LAFHQLNRLILFDYYFIVDIIKIKENKMDYTQNFSKLNNEIFKHLALSNLTKYETKLLMYLIYLVQKGNLIIASQAQISRDLGIDKSDISKCFKSLTNKNILIKNDKTSHTYLNSNILSYYADNNQEAKRNLILEIQEPPEKNTKAMIEKELEDIF